MAKSAYLQFLAVLLLATINLSVNSQESPSTERITEGTTKKPALEWAKYGQRCGPLTLCNIYGRTVACSAAGVCECNLGADALFHEPWNMCVGKVGSLCFAEANSLGRKVCVPNADCFPDKDSLNYNVGTCGCLYGFEVDAAGNCVDVPSIPDKSTLRPTTTKAPRQTRPPTTPTVSTIPTVPTSHKTTPPTGGSSAKNISNLLIISILLKFALF